MFLYHKKWLRETDFFVISPGITTYFEEPDFSDTQTSVEGAIPIGDPSTSNTVETQSQTSFEYSWEDPSPSEVENNILWCRHYRK